MVARVMFPGGAAPASAAGGPEHAPETRGAAMSEAISLAGQNRYVVGFLDRPSYDVTLIGGTLILALLAGGAVWVSPALFIPILIADLWLLGYHHVIATYTRLGFDRRCRREHAFLIYLLPVLVLAGVLAMIFVLGPWSVPTLYLYWQWFHYTRQSYGVAQAYRRKAKVDDDGPHWLQLATLYAVPFWGILARSAQQPEKFLGMEIWTVPVPGWLADGVGVVVVALLAYWVFDRVRAWRRGRLALAHTAYLASHFTIFLAGYIAIPSIDHGWLAINIWHNAQYLLFVWFFNRNRFKGGVDPEARFLSWMVQPGRAWAYFGWCMIVTVLLYASFNWTVSTLSAATATALPLALIIYQTVNFHHYIVDSLIWKMRKAPVRQTLGLAA
jgi:hypothetical protein